MLIIDGQIHLWAKGPPSGGAGLSAIPADIDNGSEW
jgi:hypothetical protein